MSQPSVKIVGTFYIKKLKSLAKKLKIEQKLKIIDKKFCRLIKRSYFRIRKENKLSLTFKELRL